MHLHEDPPSVPAGQRLPLFILVSRQGRVVVLEGMPDYADLKKLIQEIQRLPGEEEPRRPSSQEPN